MNILAIESSCDETAAAVVKDGREVLSNVISSQIDIHTEYGGVVPEIASRKHCENINYVIKQAMADAGFDIGGSDTAACRSGSCAESCNGLVEPGSGWDEIDAIAVSYGPGLVGALLVGVAEAKSLAYALNKPLIGVNHMLGHVSANYIENKDLEPPFLCLIVSGGHTNIAVMKSYTEYEIIASTRDDAAGEAFDKVARAVGLGYPGGPKVDREARNGNPDAIVFPKAKVEGSKYDFSFSGLKSAVLNYLNHEQLMGHEINRPDLVASFQKAVVDVLVEHTAMAADDLGIKKIAMAGGVASNTALREAMKKQFGNLYVPSPIFCTDNAAMIGCAAYYNPVYMGWDLNAVPSLEL